MSVDGEEEVVLDSGGPIHSSEDIPTKPPPKKRSANTALKVASRSSGGVVTATLVPSEGKGKTPHNSEQGH